MRGGHGAKLAPSHLSRHRSRIERQRHARSFRTLAERERIRAGVVVKPRLRRRASEDRRGQQRFGASGEEELPRPFHGRVVSEKRHAGHRSRHQRTGHTAPHRAIGHAGRIRRGPEHDHRRGTADRPEVGARKFHLLARERAGKPVHPEDRDAVRQGATAAGGREQEKGQNPPHER